MPLSRREFGLALSAGTLFGSSGAFAQSKTLKYGNAGNDTTLSNKMNTVLAKVVEERTGGAIKTQIFAGTLGGEQRLVEGMALGLLDVYNGAYTGVREFDLLYSPYFFKDAEQALRVMKGPIGAKAAAKLEERYKAKLIGVGRLGPYVVATKTKVSSWADLKGKKLRTPSIEGCIVAVRALGAAPTPVPFTDVYLALQNGTIDGFVSALNPSMGSKFYEVCKYLIAPPFGEALDKQLMATRVWSTFTPEQQKIYQASFDEVEVPEYYKASLTAVDADVKHWQEANGADSLITLPRAELEALMTPVNEKLAEEVFGPGSWKQIQAA